MSQATLLSTLLKLVSTLLTPAMRSSILPNAFAMPVNAVAICLRNHAADIRIPAANNFPHSILPFSSVIESHKLLKTFTITPPIFLRTDTTEPIIALRPSIKPCMKLVPSSYAMTEGEWTPKADAKAVTKLTQNSIMPDITPETLSEIPF